MSRTLLSSQELHVRHSIPISWKLVLRLGTAQVSSHRGFVAGNRESFCCRLAEYHLLRWVVVVVSVEDSRLSLKRMSCVAFSVNSLFDLGSLVVLAISKYKTTGILSSRSSITKLHVTMIDLIRAPKE